MIEIVCPVCGEIQRGDITLYNSKLLRLNLDISPIHPICNHCKSTVKINKKCCGGEIIILNGTCGSGKSTIAIELMEKYGYYAIDGDCVNQSVKHKIGNDAPDFNSKVQFNSES